MDTLGVYVRDRNASSAGGNDGDSNTDITDDGRNVIRHKTGKRMLTLVVTHRLSCP